MDLLEAEDASLFEMYFEAPKIWGADGRAGAELVDGGFDKLVTNENRQEYVILVCRRLLYDSILEAGDLLVRGFKAVIHHNIRAIELFDAADLELALCGSPRFDWKELQANTHYIGYTADSPTVVSFWDILSGWDDEELAKLIQFTTGAPKIPANGLKAMRFTIQNAGSRTDRFAHCLNMLQHSPSPRLQRPRSPCKISSQGRRERQGLRFAMIFVLFVSLING